MPNISQLPDNLSSGMTYSIQGVEMIGEKLCLVLHVINREDQIERDDMNVTVR